MKQPEIVEFVKNNIEPLPDSSRNSPIYRCSATLTDGLRLPCVSIMSKQARVERVIQRFEQCRKAKPGLIKKLIEKSKPTNLYLDYPYIVETFTCSGNRLNYYDIESLTESPFAILPERMKETAGETSMSWTQFTARMKDSNEFQFGTTYYEQFFYMPDNYTARDIVKIIPAKRGTPRNFNMKVFRERPYFECYIEGI